MFSPEIAPYKKSLHNAVVFRVFDEISKAALGLSAWPIKINTPTSQRRYLRQKIEWYRKNNCLPKELHKFLKDGQLQRLQQLEGLERLQQLSAQKISVVNFSSCSYEDVEIKANSVVYCDIPYENTEEYIRPFNRKKFLDWAADQKVPVFISEYNVSDHRFKKIYQIEKHAKLCPKEKSKNAQEKLYWNGRSLG